MENNETSNVPNDDPRRLVLDRALTAFQKFNLVNNQLERLEIEVSEGKEKETFGFLTDGMSVMARNLGRISESANIKVDVGDNSATITSNFGRIHVHLATHKGFARGKNYNSSYIVVTYSEGLKYIVPGKTSMGMSERYRLGLNEGLQYGWVNDKKEFFYSEHLAAKFFDYILDTIEYKANEQANIYYVDLEKNLREYGQQ